MMVQFYPNPMADKGVLSVFKGDEGELDIQIYDAIGKLIKQEKAAVKGNYSLELEKGKFRQEFTLIGCYSRESK